MATLHDEIDNWLAADVHGQLSEEERHALGNHLVECAACRKVHQENKIMNKILEEDLAPERPDASFEQRMLAGFRNRIPQKTGGITKLIVDLMRLRATQITAVAAILLALVQVGRMITGEGAIARRNREYLAGNEVATLPAQAPPTFSDSVAAVRKSDNRRDKETDRLAAGNPSARGQTALAAAASQAEAKDEKQALAETERTIVTGSNIPTAEEVRPNAVAPVPALANRKLIRNANVELEIANFDNAVQKITGFANEERGYVATSNSEKQANGKLRGTVVVKVVPENLDRFLQKIRDLGELKNQTLGTEDITKAYFDTDSRLKNARVMEQRLIEMLKKKSDDINDLLQVEKELGRVREQIEQMQGELKYWDTQVQFATVTIQLAEKDMEEPAAFLLKERAQLALYAPDVEKIYNDIKALASPKTQITNAQLDRDNTGRVSARISVLIAPEESDAQIGRVKTMGRVENFQVQTERVAQGGTGMSENAKTKRDKVELNVTISREEQEQAFQQTSLRIRTSTVDEKTKELRNLAEKQNGRVRNSSFSRDPDGREFANVSLRVPMKNYAALMQSLNSLGKLENVTVQRQDRTGAQIDEANAPADLSIQVYSQGNIVSQESGLFATLRRTLAQGAGALMWSARMIGVALAFLAPWAIALVAVIWIGKRITRSRRSARGE
jgi:anti-sigma factor RsiW